MAIPLEPQFEPEIVYGWVQTSTRRPVLKGRGGVIDKNFGFMYVPKPACGCSLGRTPIEKKSGRVFVKSLESKRWSMGIERTDVVLSETSSLAPSCITLGLSTILEEDNRKTISKLLIFNTLPVFIQADTTECFFRGVREIFRIGAIRLT